MGVRNPQKGQPRHGGVMSSGDLPFRNEVLKMELLKPITEFIQQLGFPIACVCYLFYSQAKERQAHEAESKAWTDALHNNTLAIQKLTDIISERFNFDGK